MKFFNRDLIQMGHSHDHAVLSRQEELWDEAWDRYADYLDSVKEKMPPGLRHIVDSYYLHDAVIHGMGQENSTFVIILQLDTPPHSLLTFTYDLLKEPVIEKNGLEPDGNNQDAVIDWQYDELEYEAVDPPTWAQSIILGNGWEICLSFRDVKVQEIQALIPRPSQRESRIGA